MSQSYSGESASERVDESFLNDRTLKWIGVAVSSLFTLGIFALVGYIVATKVNFELLQTIFPRFVDAYLLVLRIFVMGSILSVVAGVFVGFGRVSSTFPTGAVARGYVEFFRGTPLLFQIIVIYFGIPALWAGTFPIQDWEIPAAIIALTMNHAAYVGEAIRGGIGAVPDGQMEAARSLGMSYTQGMREVVLPQAWRNALAAIGNDQVILIKDTSLLTVIAVPEIISVFRSVNSATFDPWTPIVLTAVAYLGITLPLGFLVRYLESRSDWGGDRR
ncbi:amino acid ABC transporter membrane protein, PAAT family (TC 3.A.1.3.-) [Halogranum amylolyticum]|uniref:Amino acid ABC transporter membrane protein, PAAT family (TC 3.A.1.3.-) n=1 Tax=Halogranum amylolyticum TaxID=660520 RepID=A0A1H8RKG6_9EURY|nr:amino acid ABC transporter permease [Halogranum amylolyticum]SEO66674.1 amino acid ABC transporter membrane protein, PAAT family (TC 3.A.1.3.-) [Halogranum amylolyticum]